MTILSKACKPDNFESHNSLKLSFRNIQGLRSNFVDCESFLESNSPDILALCETNLDDSIDSGNFSVRGYLPLIRKDSGTHMHSLAVYVKEGLPFARDLFLENSADSYLCFRLALLYSVSYFFFLYQSRSAFCTAFDSISSNIDEVLSINPSANVFAFGGFNVHHKDWLTYSTGTDRPGELCYNFSISNDLTQMVNFPTRIPVDLLHKLNSYGISGQIFCLISSFLSNRQLRVVLDGKSSQEYPVNAGVPQGSILGPTFFLLYINDLPDDVICDIAIYADDTTLYSKCDWASDQWKQLELASELESDLQDTVDWGKKWLVDFNAGKLSWLRLTGLITMVLLM